MKDFARVTTVLLLIVAAFTWTAAANVIQALERNSSRHTAALSPANAGDLP